MVNTPDGGRKAAATNKKRHGEDFYRNIGRKGGLAPRSTPRGFAAMSHDRLVQISKIGGRRSRRGPAKYETDDDKSNN